MIFVLEFKTSRNVTFFLMLTYYFLTYIDNSSRLIILSSTRAIRVLRGPPELDKTHFKAGTRVKGSNLNQSAFVIYGL